ncbi:MAG: hypothetical protein ACE5F6_02810 [Anaerolineae bacterium]
MNTTARILQLVAVLILASATFGCAREATVSPAPTDMPYATNTPPPTSPPATAQKVATTAPLPTDTPPLTHTVPPTSPPATATPRSTDTPAPTSPPATPWGVSAVVMAQALNVRSGPGVTYPRVGTVTEGTRVALDGRDEAGTWVRGEMPAEEAEGWLSATFMEIEGDMMSLPVIEVGPPPPPPATATPAGVVEVVPAGLNWVVTDKRVTALYRDESGTIYFGGPKNTQGIGDPFHAEAAVWKKPVDGEPIQLTPFAYNAIGGIVVHNGFIYFNEAGSLRRVPDDNQMHDAEVVLHFPNLSTIYMHINHALVKYRLNGEDGVLIAVGSRLDSNFDAPQHFSGIQPPYYEDFPTGRILFAPLSWLETVKNYEVREDRPGEVSEFARGVRNPWSMAAGYIGGRIRVFAGDNDPTFTPEKADDNPQNAGEELTEILQGRHHGHPYFYAGREPEPEYVKPAAVFPDGSVPSGVAIAAGKVFVSLHSAAMIVKVDLATGSWTPVMTDIQVFNLFGYGNLLYVADWAGIRVVDARGL